MEVNYFENLVLNGILNSLHTYLRLFEYDAINESYLSSIF